MTNFDVRIVQRNQRTNKIIDDMLRKLKADKAKRVDINLIDRVLRNYAIILNECEIHEVEPLDVMEATIATAVTMLTEYMNRTIPRSNISAIHGSTQDILTDFSAAFMSSIENAFGVKFERMPAPAPAGAVVQ